MKKIISKTAPIAIAFALLSQLLTGCTTVYYVPQPTHEGSLTDEKFSPPVEMETREQGSDYFVKLFNTGTKFNTLECKTITDDQSSVTRSIVSLLPNGGVNHAISSSMTRYQRDGNAGIKFSFDEHGNYEYRQFYSSKEIVLERHGDKLDCRIYENGSQVPKSKLDRYVSEKGIYDFDKKIKEMIDGNENLIRSIGKISPDKLREGIIIFHKTSSLSPAGYSSDVAGLATRANARFPGLNFSAYNAG